MSSERSDQEAGGRGQGSELESKVLNLEPRTLNPRASKPRWRRRRRGVVVVLAAVFSVIMLGLIAFALDVGYISLVRTQLQTAADSAALAAAGSTNLSRADTEAVARQYAGYHKAAGRPVQLNSADIQYGTWDTATRSFTPTSQVANAVRVTTRTDASTGGETRLFFARIFNVASVSQQASAVATVNPRDIAFVVDLSGSMNDDTDPSNTDGINSTFAAQGYPTIGTDLMQQVYDDFGFGSFPGASQCVGAPLGVSPSNGDPLTQLMSKTGPLSRSSIPSQYRIESTDRSSVRRQKAYSWTMDVQIPLVMPAAKPGPNSTTNYAYWAAYLDDYHDSMGYRSYTEFMMYNGRDLRPDGATYTPLSLNSTDCPMHYEDTPGGRFLFPPREQPTHAARRAMIAALKVIKDRNQSISDMNQRDWVSIITFDTLTGGGPVVRRSLTGDYDAAMQVCTQLQACSSSEYSTATDAGLIAASNHIKPQSQGGSGRNQTNKIVVLLTDGMPNLYVTSNSQINSYVHDNPSSNFYTDSSQKAKQAPLMQTLQMQLNHWYAYPVGVGLGTDYDFMDRMARMGTTANQDGQSPRGSSNPADYESRLTEIFQNIITNPKLRLVQ